MNNRSAKLKRTRGFSQGNREKGNFVKGARKHLTPLNDLQNSLSREKYLNLSLLVSLNKRFESRSVKVASQALLHVWAAYCPQATIWPTKGIHVLYKKVFAPSTETFLAFSQFQYQNFLRLPLQKFFSSQVLRMQIN